MVWHMPNGERQTEIKIGKLFDTDKTKFITAKQKIIVNIKGN